MISPSASGVQTLDGSLPFLQSSSPKPNHENGLAFPFSSNSVWFVLCKSCGKVPEKIVKIVLKVTRV
jgi:hypothetical protein